MCGSLPCEWLKISKASSVPLIPRGNCEAPLGRNTPGKGSPLKDELEDIRASFEVWVVVKGGWDFEITIFGILEEGGDLDF